MNQRIKEIANYYGRSTNAFAKSLDIPQPTMKNYIDGVRNAPSDVLQKILAIYPEISAEWLLRGKGKMLIDNSLTHETQLQPSPSIQLTTLETALVAMTTHLSHQDRLIDKLTDLSAESQERMMSVNKIVEKLSEIGTTFADHMRKKDIECAELKQEIKETKIEASRANELLTQFMNTAIEKTTSGISFGQVGKITTVKNR